MVIDSGWNKLLDTFPLKKRAGKRHRTSLMYLTLLRNPSLVTVFIDSRKALIQVMFEEIYVHLHKMAECFLAITFSA